MRCDVWRDRRGDRVIAHPRAHLRAHGLTREAATAIVASMVTDDGWSYRLERVSGSENPFDTMLTKEPSLFAIVAYDETGHRLGPIT
jgi:hypothetical protein